MSAADALNFFLDEDNISSTTLTAKAKKAVKSLSRGFVKALRVKDSKLVAGGQDGTRLLDALAKDGGYGAQEKAFMALVIQGVACVGEASEDGISPAVCTTRLIHVADLNFIKEPAKLVDGILKGLENAALKEVMRTQVATFILSVANVAKLLIKASTPNTPAITTTPTALTSDGYTTKLFENTEFQRVAANPEAMQAAISASQGSAYTSLPQLLTAERHELEQQAQSRSLGLRDNLLHPDVEKEDNSLASFINWLQAQGGDAFFSDENLLVSLPSWVIDAFDHGE